MRNVRITQDMRDRASECAADVNVPLSEWCRRAVRLYDRGKLDGVAIAPALESTTGKTIPTSMDIGPEHGPDTVRMAVYAAVRLCEKRRKPGFTPPLKEGVHYEVKRTD